MKRSSPQRKLANADGFIRRLPQGYNTLLRGNGANLSQGQRQLLSIARAAVADPPVLILDEATSSIDTRTEKLVQDGMDKLMEGRTTFVIAHRLSTVRNSDCIMVLEQGRIIERGSHEELAFRRAGIISCIMADPGLPLFPGKNISRQKKNMQGTSLWDGSACFIFHLSSILSLHFF